MNGQADQQPRHCGHTRAPHSFTLETQRQRTPNSVSVNMTDRRADGTRAPRFPGIGGQGRICACSLEGFSVDPKIFRLKINRKDIKSCRKNTPRYVFLSGLKKKKKSTCVTSPEMMIKETSALLSAFTRRRRLCCCSQERLDFTSHLSRGCRLALFTLPLTGGGEQNSPTFGTAVCAAPRGHGRTAINFLWMLPLP